MNKSVWFIVLLIGLIVGCQKKSTTNDIIPRETFKDILIDVHLVDGFYMTNYSTFTFHSDSVNFYSEVLKEYGYTMPQFDSTYRHYVRNIKEFDVLYEEVITELNKMQQQSFKLMEMGGDTLRNLYRGKKNWKLPKDGVMQKIPFDIKIKDSANYTISIFLKRFPDDESENPRLTAYFEYDNEKKEVVKDYFTETSYRSSRRFIVYSFSKATPNKKVKKLKGYFIDHSNTSYFKKRFEIKGIYISKN